MISKNKRFGHLVVLGEAQPLQVVRGERVCHWSASWCRCDCGATCVVPDWRLRTGHVKSCGCGKLAGLRNSRHTKVPRIGARIGALVVTAHLPDRVDRHGVHHTRSSFQCICGRIVEMDNSNARRRQGTGCFHESIRGAMSHNCTASRSVPRQPRMLRLALPGGRFGSLIVGGCRVEWKSWPTAYAMVRCDCGATFETWVENLRQGRVMSCPSCAAQKRKSLQGVNGQDEIHDNGEFPPNGSQRKCSQNGNENR